MRNIILLMLAILVLGPHVSAGMVIVRLETYVNFGGIIDTTVSKFVFDIGERVESANTIQIVCSIQMGTCCFRIPFVYCLICVFLCFFVPLCGILISGGRKR